VVLALALCYAVPEEDFGAVPEMTPSAAGLVKEIATEDEQFVEASQEMRNDQALPKSSRTGTPGAPTVPRRSGSRDGELEAQTASVNVVVVDGFTSALCRARKGDHH